MSKAEKTEREIDKRNDEDTKEKNEQAARQV